MSTPIVHVSEFVKSVSRRTFSIANVWGTRRNMNAFLASVDLYIKLGRYERLTVAQFAANIDLQSYYMAHEGLDSLYLWLHVYFTFLCFYLLDSKRFY